MRRGLIALVWILSLSALYYGVADWRDRHAWNEYRQKYEAHVAPLELQAYVPKPIPDSDNFAAIPFVQTWFGSNRDSNLLNRDTWSQAGKLMSTNWRSEKSRRFLDLVGWQEAFAAVRSKAETPKGGFQTDNLELASRAQAAPAVLDGLKDDEAAFEELRAASARPDARYPVVYDLDNPWGILLPHLWAIKFTCLRLQIKASAELALGQNEKALEDVKLLLYLTDTLKTEPFLISYLVRAACLHIAIRPIWEGLAEHHWTDAQLQQLQARLEAYDFLADMQSSLRSERAAGVLTVDLLRKKGLDLLATFEDEASPVKFDQQQKALLGLLGRMMPAGWYDQEKLHYCELYDDEFRGIVDVSSRRVFAGRITTNGSKSGAFAKSNGDFAYGTPTRGMWHAIFHHDIMAALLLPSLARIPIRAAAAQTDADQAAIACALERYRLANGQFPGDLQALVPRFAAHLPNDLITGEPYIYRRSDDDLFVLYSVGWNEKDDGGTPGATMFDETAGDWVW